MLTQLLVLTNDNNDIDNIDEYEPSSEASTPLGTRCARSINRLIARLIAIASESPCGDIDAVVVD